MTTSPAAPRRPWRPGPPRFSRALEARGIDAAPLAAQAGIDPAALGPDARVPRAALNRLWELAVEATGDPAFGLEASRFAAQTTFHALGYAVLASVTLKEAFERIIRYRRLIGDVLELRLVEAGDRYRFQIDVSAQPGVPFQAVDAIAAICVRQARLLHAPRPCNPLAVTFARPEPADAEPYRRVFRAPVRFASRSTHSSTPAPTWRTAFPPATPSWRAATTRSWCAISPVWSGRASRAASSRRCSMRCRTVRRQSPRSRARSA